MAYVFSIIRRLENEGLVMCKEKLVKDNGEERKRFFWSKKPTGKRVFEEEPGELEAKTDLA